MEFEVLGALRVVGDGEAIDVGSRLQRILLLSLLADPGQPRSTDRLIEDLWGDTPPRDPVTSIHSYISKLRRALEPGRNRTSPSQYLVRGDGGYAIRLRSAQLDAKLFEQEVEAARSNQRRPAEVVTVADRALSRWRGEPFSDAASKPFAAAPIASLLTLRAEIERLRVAAHLELDEVAAALTGAQELAIRYPLDESCHALLMTALYRSGRQTEALRTYASIRHRLVSELGLEPGTELKALEERILRQDDALETGRHGVSARAVTRCSSGRPPLVGRSDELAELLGVLDESRVAPTPSTAIVVGEAGIGKTRLVEEAADRIGEQNDLVVWVQCERGARASGLLPLASALRSALDSPFAAALGATPAHADAVTVAERLLHHDGPSRSPFEERNDALRYQQFDACRQILSYLAKATAVVLVVEDLHWASEPMVDALAFLSSRRDLGPVTLVVTARSDPPTSDGVAPALSRLGSLNRHRIVLGGLDQSAVEELATGSVGSAGHLIAQGLCDRTGGNPFFVNELLRVLDRDDPVGSLTQSQTPASISDAILARFDDLTNETIDLLTVASLAGQWFDPLVCADVASTTTPAVDLIDSAIGAGLVIEHPTIVGRCSFRHDLVRSAISSRLSNLRRSKIHAELGTALLAVHGFDNQETIAEVAQHLSLGAACGTGLLGARAGTIASKVALDRHDGIEATRLARQALDGLSYVKADESISTPESELWLDLAAGLRRIGDPLGSQVAARTAFAKAQQSGSPADMARAATCFNGGPSVSPWLGYWSPPGEAVAMLDRAYAALSDVERRSDVGFRLLCALSEANCDIGDYAGAEAATQRVLGLAAAEGRESWLPEALLQRLRVVSLAGSAPDRRALIERTIDSSRSSPDHQALALRARTVEELERCDLGRAREGIHRLRALALEARSDLIELDADVLSIALDLLLGRLERAEDDMGAALVRYEHFEPTRLSMIELQMARLLYERHALDTVEEHFRTRLADHDTPSWRAPLALLLSEHDRHDEARAVLEAMTESDFGRLHQSVLQFMTPCLLADAVSNLADRTRAGWLLDLLLPLTDRLISFNYGQILPGWVGLPVGRLLGVVGRFAEAEAVLTDARTRAQRLGSSLFEQRADVALLELDCRAGRRPRSSTATAHDRATDAGFLGVAYQAEQLD